MSDLQPEQDLINDQTKSLLGKRTTPHQPSKYTPGPPKDPKNTKSKDGTDPTKSPKDTTSAGSTDLTNKSPTDPMESPKDTTNGSSTDLTNKSPTDPMESPKDTTNGSSTDLTNKSPTDPMESPKDTTNAGSTDLINKSPTDSTKTTVLDSTKKGSIAPINAGSTDLINKSPTDSINTTVIDSAKKGFIAPINASSTDLTNKSPTDSTNTTVIDLTKKGFIDLGCTVITNSPTDPTKSPKDTTNADSTDLINKSPTDSTKTTVLDSTKKGSIAPINAGSTDLTNKSPTDSTNTTVLDSTKKGFIAPINTSLTDQKPSKPKAVLPVTITNSETAKAVGLPEDCDERLCQSLLNLKDWVANDWIRSSISAQAEIKKSTLHMREHKNTLKNKILSNLADAGAIPSPNLRSFFEGLILKYYDEIATFLFDYTLKSRENIMDVDQDEVEQESIRIMAAKLLKCIRSRHSIYKLLEVEKSDTVQEIRQEYTEKMLMFHEDKRLHEKVSGITRGDVVEITQALNNARDILNNPQLRQQYDASIEITKVPPPVQALHKTLNEDVAELCTTGQLSQPKQDKLKRVNSEIRRYNATHNQFPLETYQVSMRDLCVAANLATCFLRSLTGEEADLRILKQVFESIQKHFNMASFQWPEEWIVPYMMYPLFRQLAELNPEFPLGSQVLAALPKNLADKFRKASVQTQPPTSPHTTARRSAVASQELTTQPVTQPVRAGYTREGHKILAHTLYKRRNVLHGKRDAVNMKVFIEVPVSEVCRNPMRWAMAASLGRDVIEAYQSLNTVPINKDEKRLRNRPPSSFSRILGMTFAREHRVGVGNVPAVHVLAEMTDGSRMVMHRTDFENWMESASIAQRYIIDAAEQLQLVPPWADASVARDPNKSTMYYPASKYRIEPAKEWRRRVYGDYGAYKAVQNGPNYPVFMQPNSQLNRPSPQLGYIPTSAPFWGNSQQHLPYSNSTDNNVNSQQHLPFGSATANNDVTALLERLVVTVNGLVERAEKEDQQLLDW